MTNREKYAKEILDIVCAGEDIAVKNGEPCECDNIECSECDLRVCANCNVKFVKWCNAEYVEPQIDWSKVPIDTPILVRDSEMEPWFRAHFAGVIKGSVYAFRAGLTSWGEDRKSPWTYARIADVNSLDKNSLLRGNGREEE